jgi:hypothetical protein
MKNINSSSNKASGKKFKPRITKKENNYRSNRPEKCSKLRQPKDQSNREVLLKKTAKFKSIWEQKR